MFLRLSSNLITIFTLVIFSKEASAATYKPLVEIPGADVGSGVGPLFNQLFQIGLTIAAVLAVIMIAVGGFQYMTTDAVGKKSEGRERIQNAILGLILALMIFIILKTINPQLLNLNPGGDQGIQPVNVETKSLNNPLKKGGGGL
ncbi:MAG: pilin [Candidatus Pacebacteria bacterium]|jgi:hypothetical protein|nr:pilin [Candidatus Paceibacterota bacterium]